MLNICVILTSQLDYSLMFMFVFQYLITFIWNNEMNSDVIVLLNIYKSTCFFFHKTHAGILPSVN